MNRIRWVETGVAVLVLAGALGTPVLGAQKKEDIILAELRHIQVQLSQLQTSHAALEGRARSAQSPLGRTNELLGEDSGRLQVEFGRTAGGYLHPDCAGRRDEWAHR